MPNLTSVHVTSGIPDAGTGTVSTIDELIVVGLPLTGGTVTVAGGNITAVVSGTTFISGGTNLTAVVSGTTFVSGGNITAVVSGTTFISGGNATAELNQGGSALSATNGIFGNVLFNNTLVSASVGLPVNIVSGSVSVGAVTASLNQGGAAISSTNGIFGNVLFNNTLVSASVGLPVTILSGSGLTAVISGTTFVSGGNVTAVVSGTTFISGGSNITAVVSGTTFVSGGTMTAIASGDVASGASDIGNPLKIGGLAKTANPTGVTDGQRVNGLFDVMGKMVVVQSIRALKANLFTTLPGTTSEITLLPAISTCFQDIYGCIIANTAASSCTIVFKDSTAGNSQFELNVPAGDTRGFMMPESGAFKQAAQNTTWTITMGAAVTSLIASVLFVKNTTA